MNIWVIGLAAGCASALTLYSGFGLGTILMPVLALFFPVEEAIAVTAAVHLTNNLLKLALLGKDARRQIALKFGIPAVGGALLGAWLLGTLAVIPAIAQYQFLGAVRSVSPVKCVVAALMIGFGFVEVLPRFGKLTFPSRYLPLGGCLSGFFGGLSGHQGAFRSAFLAKSGISTESFLGTGAVIAVMVDLARISVYAGHLRFLDVRGALPVLICATLTALLGTVLSLRIAKRITIRAVQRLVAAFLTLIGLGLASGLI